ncbi:hypothetical protein PIB30_092418 [Stylosanthes scabra]|uniref:Uncharacterized protein n=1 Tax=Stylosanthes scabra TaxID=79078 RepID=A0ABU6XUJ5_9FABA|nr:hypothetical protein [Stylosanthes scabra]
MQAQPPPLPAALKSQPSPSSQHRCSVLSCCHAVTAFSCTAPSKPSPSRAVATSSSLHHLALSLIVHHRRSVTASTLCRRRQTCRPRLLLRKFVQQLINWVGSQTPPPYLHHLRVHSSNTDLLESIVGSVPHSWYAKDTQRINFSTLPWVVCSS